MAACSAGGIVFEMAILYLKAPFSKTFHDWNRRRWQCPYDIAIIKLSPDGSNRLYATYLEVTVTNSRIV